MTLANATYHPRLAGIAGLVATALVAASCASPAATPAPTAETDRTAEADSPSPTSQVKSPTPAPEPVQLTALTGFGINGYQAALFAGVAEGFFADEGIDLIIEPGSGSAGDNANIGAGAADLGFHNGFDSMAIAVGEGVPIKGVLVTYPVNPQGLCYVAERNTINDWEDLEGLSHGGPAGSAVTKTLIAAMEFLGGDPTQVEEVIMDGAATSPALLAGSIDLAGCTTLTLYPRALAAEEEGLTLEMFSFAEHGFDAMGYGLVASNALIEEQPEVVQRVVNAYARAIIWSIENPDEACDHFIATNPEKNRDIECESFKFTLPLYTGEDGEYFTFSDEQAQLTVDFIREVEGYDLELEDFYAGQFYEGLSEDLKEGRLDR